MVGWDVAEAVAQRARGTPRIANTFLKRIRDYADLELTRVVDVPFVNKIIGQKLHTDAIGLRPLDHRYLRYLERQDSPVGVEVIASAIAEEADTVQDFIEPYLMKLGFMERRLNGRCLTSEGRKFLNMAKSRG
jgi:Holliday junction DNA helicase RuvB